MLRIVYQYSKLPETRNTEFIVCESCGKILEEKDKLVLGMDIDAILGNYWCTHCHKRVKGKRKSISDE